jgi:Ras-related protein Rab-8A
MAKIVIIGDSGVGKTNILTRFCSNVFKDTHVATIGVDFNVRTIQI